MGPTARRAALAAVTVVTTAIVGSGVAAGAAPPGGGEATAYSVVPEGPSGPQPQQVAVDSASGTRYVRNSDPSFRGVTVVPTGGIASSVQTEEDPVGLVVDAATRLLFVAETHAGGGSVVAYHLDGAGSPTPVVNWSTAATPVALAAGGGRVYVITSGPAELVVLDEGDLTPVATSLLAGTPTAVCYDATDARVLVTETLASAGLLSAYTSNGTLLNRLALAGSDPSEVVVDPGLQTAVVLNGPLGSPGAAVAAFDPNSLLPLASRTASLPGARAAVVDPDRHLLYVAVASGGIDVLSLPGLALLQAVSLARAQPSALALLSCSACPAGVTDGSLDVTDAAADELLGVRPRAAATSPVDVPGAAAGSLEPDAGARVTDAAVARGRTGSGARNRTGPAGAGTGHAVTAAPGHAAGADRQVPAADPGVPGLSGGGTAGLARTASGGGNRQALDGKAAAVGAPATAGKPGADTRPNRLPAALDFTRSLPSPTETPTRAADLVKSSLLALLLLALLGLPVTMINRTTTAHAEELAAALLQVRRWLLLDRAGPHVEQLPRPVVLGSGALGTAALSALVEPHLGWDVSSLALIGGLLGGFLVTSVAESLVETGIMRRTYQTGGVVRLLPGYALVAVVSVIVSRLGHLQPGLLLGVLVVVRPLRRLHEKQEGHAYAIAWLVLGLLGAAAWTLRSPVLSTLGSPYGSASQAVGAALTTIVAVAIEALAFAMVPLSFMPGLAVLRWSKTAWAILWGVGAFAFVHVLLAPESASADGESTRSPVVLLAAYLLAAGAYWGGFALHDARAGREAVPDQAELEHLHVPELVSS